MSPRLIVTSILLSSLVFNSARTAHASSVITQLGAERQTTVDITVGYVHYIQPLLVLPPFPPPAPIDVLPGSHVRLSTGYTGTAPVSIFWSKDGIEETDARDVLNLTTVAAADSGIYTAEIWLNGLSYSTYPLTLRVVSPVRQQLLNLSSRTTLSPANPTLIAGFVIAQSPGALTEHKLLLFRAVGPTLLGMGVARPLAKPRFRLFKADGTEFVPLSPPPTPVGLEPVKIAAAVGAFPLRSDAGEVQLALELPAGAYTAQVSSGDNESGDVLFELYEVSQEIINRLTADAVF